MNDEDFKTNYNKKGNHKKDTPTGIIESLRGAIQPENYDFEK